MGSGKLGAADLVAATSTLLYTVPAEVIATVNVRFTNRGESETKIRLAIGSGASVSDADFVTYDQSLPAHGIIEDTGIVCSPNENVWAYSESADVSVRVHGFEEN
jgi:uncharacterized protein (UPF0248 family)